MAGLRSAARRTITGLDCSMHDYAGRDDALRTNAVEFAGADGDVRIRALVRPSGTEPKLKAYVEAVTPISATVDAGGARRDATALAERVAHALLA